MPKRRKKTRDEPAAESERDFGQIGAPFRRTSFHHGLFMGLGLLLAYLLYIAVQATLSLLIAIVVAGFIAIGLNPLVTRLRRWGMPRGAAVAAVFLGAFLVLCAGIVSLVPPIVNEGTVFIESLPEHVTELGKQEWLVRLDERLGIVEQLSKAAKEIDTTTVLNAAGGVASVVGIAVGGMFNILMVALLTLYFLVAFDRLKAGFYRLIPASRRARAQALGDEILAKVGGYTVGALGIGLTAGGSSFVFMIVAGIPYAYALAFLVALLDLIPQIGATIGAVLVTLVGLTVSVWVALAAAIFFILYQQLENWLIYPAIMRRSVKVSDLGAILGILIGAGLMGVVGALLAVPAVAALQLIVREVYIPRQDVA